MKKRMIVMGMSVVLIFVFLFTTQVDFHANGDAQTIISENLSDFDNTLNNLDVYGTTCNSYMEKTLTGCQEILVDDRIYVLDFDKNGRLLSEKIIDFELPIFGGYYAGETYNYLVYGQKPSSEESEVYRVVKYDKEFNRLDVTSVFYKECYTSVPFEAGNVSIAEEGNHMVVYTSRLRPDGHQSNIALRINTDTMKIENKYGMIAFPDIHVSHSFRQIVKYDGEQPIYVDLGDAYPRAVCLQEQEGIQTNMLYVEGDEGDNLTNTDVTGLAITDTGYLVVGTQMRNYCNNIYLSYAQKGQKTAKVIWLTNSTSYNYSNVCNAKIVQISDDVYAVMWNCFDNGGSVNYVMVNGQGELMSDLKMYQGAELTQCEPIIIDGKVTWSKYVESERKVYALTDFSCIGTYTYDDDYVLPEHVWDGSSDISWYEERKKEYHLETPEQVAGLAELVNSGNSFKGKTIYIEKDMFFNDVDSIENAWTSIAATSSGNTFEGTFDGQGYIFYNIYSISGEDGGVFGRIGENGIVKAIKVSQSLMCGASIAYQNDGWILFCENDSLVENLGDTSYTAGICCINTNFVYGCANTGVIMGDSPSGIVGLNSGTGATVDSCWNQGLIKGNGFAAAGIVGSNFGWVYDCYNSGTVSGVFLINYAKTVAGIVGGHHGYDGGIYNCYNVGYLDIYDEWNWYCNDTICGEGKSLCENVYSIASKYNSSTEITFAQLKTTDTIEKLQGDKIITKWCIDQKSGYIVPIAQQDMLNDVYKILPDVWDPITEVTINLADGEYSLEAFSYAYYGIENAEAIYSSDSDILSITSDGIITPINKGTAIVKVNFGGTEHAKETSFDVQVTIIGLNGDVNSDGKVNLQDLMKCLHYTSGRISLGEVELKASDVTGDDKVTVADVMKMMHYISGRIETL